MTTPTGRTESISRVVGTTQIIGREAIERSTARSVAELMAENAVGFLSEWTPGQTSLNIRGAATEGQGRDFRSQVLVLINGHRAGTANISKLSIADSGQDRDRSRPFVGGLWQPEYGRRGQPDHEDRAVRSRFVSRCQHREGGDIRVRGREEDGSRDKRQGQMGGQGRRHTDGGVQRARREGQQTKEGWERGRGEEEAKRRGRRRGGGGGEGGRDGGGRRGRGRGKKGEEGGGGGEEGGEGVGGGEGEGGEEEGGGLGRGGGWGGGVREREVGTALPPQRKMGGGS